MHPKTGDPDAEYAHLQSRSRHSHTVANSFRSPRSSLDFTEIMSQPQGESTQALLAALTSQLQSMTVQTNISAVSLKLPEFWTTSPEVWFARVEVQFGTKNISTDQTKYDYIVSALDVKTAEEVQDILVNPPDANKYSVLKRALLKAFGKSQAQRDNELLNLNGLGDRKPTALLRKINALNDGPQSLKRALFLSNLPTDIRSILTGQDFGDIQKSQKLLTGFGRHEVHVCSKLSTLPIALLLLQLQSKLSPGLDFSLSVALDPKPHQHKLCAIITSNLAHKLVAANLGANFRPCCLRETTMPAAKRGSSWQSASTKHVFCC